MSYLRSAPSFPFAAPLRKSSGLIFVIALHVAAITAIKSGLIVKVDVPSIPPIHVLPTLEIPKSPPLPIKQFVPRETHSTIYEKPEISKIETESIDKTPPVIPLTQRGSDDGQTGKPVAVIIDARVDPAHPLTQPNYPAAARRNGEQGRVELMLYILANGKVGEAHIDRSSGFQRLDESALREALRSWRFIPQQENGVATASWQRFAITFRLEN